MNSFLKIFLASLAALFVFTIAAFFMFIGFVSGLASKDKVKTGSKAVLVVDMATMYPEVAVENPFAALGRKEQYDIPSMYDAVRLIRHAKTDNDVKGIYIKMRTKQQWFCQQ